jgi:DNA-binding HxlR family transcriptional regulator
VVVGGRSRVEHATTPLTDEIREPLEARAPWADRNRPAISAARHAYDDSH